MSVEHSQTRKHWGIAKKCSHKTAHTGWFHIGKCMKNTLDKQRFLFLSCEQVQSKIGKDPCGFSTTIGNLRAFHLLVSPPSPCGIHASIFASWFKIIPETLAIVSKFQARNRKKYWGTQGLQRREAKGNVSHSWASPLWGAFLEISPTSIYLSLVIPSCKRSREV